MFFVLAKVLSFFTLPSNILISLGLVGILLMRTRFAQAGRRLAARLFESFGIAKERIILEGKSRDTEENARFTKELLQPKPGERWLLVTSAHHMPRSVGVFRAAGFPVEALPVDYRTRGAADILRPFSTLGDGLRRTDTAMREWVGLAIYRMVGRTEALFREIGSA